MRERTALDRERAPTHRARPTAFGAHAAKGEGKGEGDAVPHDDSEPLATRVQAHSPTHSRAEPGPPGPGRGHPKESVDRRYRGLHGRQRPAQAHAPLCRAYCSAANLPVIRLSSWHSLK